MSGDGARLRHAARPAAAQAQKITIGKIIGGNGFHIPSYVAMDQGFFKEEGLDAQLRLA